MIEWNVPHWAAVKKAFLKKQNKTLHIKEAPKLKKNNMNHYVKEKGSRSPQSLLG